MEDKKISLDDDIINHLKKYKDSKGSFVKVVDAFLGENGMKPNTFPGFIGKYGLKLASMAVKEGWAKAKDITDAAANFGNKNLEDDTGIDFNNIQINENGFRTRYFLDSGSSEKLNTLINEYKKLLENSKKDVEEKQQELETEIKQKDVKVDEQDIKDHGEVILNVMSKPKFKNENGEKLTKTVESALNTKKELTKIISDAKKLKKASKKSTKNTKDDSESSTKPSEKKSNNIAKTSKTLSQKVKKGIKTEYKESVKVGIVKSDDFKTQFIKNGFKGIWVEKQLKSPYVAAVVVDYYDDDTDDVLMEKNIKPGYRVNPINGQEKNQGLKKIYEFITKVMTETLGKDNIGKIHKYRKRWVGDNPDGNFDQLYVFTQYHSDKTIDESYIINEVKRIEILNVTDILTPELSKELIEKIKDRRNHEVIQSAEQITRDFYQEKFGSDIFSKLAEKIQNGGGHVNSGGVKAALNYLGNQIEQGNDIASAIDGIKDVTKIAKTTADTIKTAKETFDDAYTDFKKNGVNFGQLRSEIEKMKEFSKDGILSQDEISYTQRVAARLKAAAQVRNESVDIYTAKETRKIFNEYQKTIDEMKKEACKVGQEVAGAGEEAAQKAAATNPPKRGPFGKLIDKFISSGTGLGWAIVGARTFGIILNNGKDAINAIGEYAMKRQEDSGVVAYLNFKLTNNNDDKKYNDTQFSVRYDINDMKWHAVNMDDRKMKIPEDVIIKRIFETQKGKEFKNNCLKSWNRYFGDGGEYSSVVKFIIDNWNTIGMGKDISKEFLKSIKKLSKDFEQVKQQFEDK